MKKLFLISCAVFLGPSVRAGGEEAVPRARRGSPALTAEVTPPMDGAPRARRGVSPALETAVSAPAAEMGRAGKVDVFKPWKLFEPGADVIAYEKHGQFQGLGTDGYAYVMEDAEGLAREAGEGVFPNTDSVLRDPDCRGYLGAGLLQGSPWDSVNGPDPRRSFFMWATAKTDPGVTQFFMAYALERGGHWLQALKAYHACLIHFPGAVGITYWNSPWYIGPTALDRIHYILRENPGLGLKLEDADLFIGNGFNNDVKDDRVICRPGRFVRVSPAEAARAYAREDISKRKVDRVLFPAGPVNLVRYDNGHWQLRVDGKPYVIRGMVYQPNPVGLSPDNGTLNPTRDWQTADANKNGLADGPFDAWVDANRNGRQDADEEAVGDFALMRDMGVNTVRIYHHAFNRPLLDTLYRTYGIRVVMGDLLGAYTVGSDAPWATGTDYTDPAQKKRMLENVRKMVLEYKDHPAVLLWVLGNENVYGTNTNAPAKPAAWFSFVNEAAKLIKSLDPTRPVAVANGDLVFVDVFAKNCPDVDIFGCNAYRGNHGFGRSLWDTVRRLADKPVFISEYGCPAYHKDKSPEDAETIQAAYLAGNWRDIDGNTAGAGVGNSLGGFLFEWTDEWWKAGTPPQFDPAAHDATGQWQGPFPDGWMYEEWLGIVDQGDGRQSPFLRHLRKAYFVLRDLWRGGAARDGR